MPPFLTAWDALLINLSAHLKTTAILLADGKGVLEFRNANRRRRLPERGERCEAVFIPADAISVTYVESDAIRVGFVFPRRAPKTSCEHFHLR